MNSCKGGGPGTLYNSMLKFGPSLSKCSYERFIKWMISKSHNETFLLYFQQTILRFIHRFWQDTLRATGKPSAGASRGHLKDFVVIIQSLSICRSQPLFNVFFFTEDLVFASRVCWMKTESILSVKLSYWLPHKCGEILLWVSAGAAGQSWAVLMGLILTSTAPDE